MLTLFIIAIAAAEIGLGLAIVLLVFRTAGSRRRPAARPRRPRPGRRAGRRGRRADRRRSLRAWAAASDRRPLAAACPPLTPSLGAGRLLAPFARPGRARLGRRRAAGWSAIGRRCRRRPALAVALAGSGRERSATRRDARARADRRAAVRLAFRVDELPRRGRCWSPVVALVVQVYSVAYLRGDPRYPSYTAFVSLFTAAMLLVVHRRRPVRAAGRLGGHGPLLVPPDRPPLGAAGRPGPARSRRSW